MVRTILLVVIAVGLSVSASAQKSVTLSKGTVVTFRTVAEDIGYPASITQEPNGMLWLTDRTSGRVLRVDPGTGAATTVLEVKLTSDPVDPTIRGGVYGLALHPAFANGMPYVFVSTTTADDRLIIERYRFSGERLVNPVVIYVTNGVPHSLGLTMEALSDNTLLVSVASFDTQDPIRLDNVNGKIIRMTFDGDAVASNPMYQSNDPRSARSYIYSMGHRNPLGLVQLPVTHATLPGAVFSSECGPLSFDEINRIESGRNYGWLNTAGYCTTSVQNLACPLATMNQAPSGMAYYSSSAIPEWTNSLLLGTLRGRGMVVAELSENGTIANIDAERPADDVMQLASDQLIDLSLNGESEKVIDVTVSSDGRVYVALFESSDAWKGRIVALENLAVHGPLSVEGDELTFSSGFRFGPNPVSDVMNVSLDRPFTTSWTATIVDLNGATVSSAQFTSGTTQISMSTSDLASGAYMLVLKDATQTLTTTFIR